MSENLVSWYPEGAEQFHGKVFMKTLETVRPDLYKQAEDIFSKEKAELKGNRLNASLASLQAMINREEKKEDSLLNNIFHTSGYRGMEAGQRIKAINALYQTKGIFQANIAKIQAIQDNKGGGRIDITTKFPYYLEEEIKKLNIETLSEETIKKCIEQALYTMFDKVEKNGDQPYIELAQALDDLKARTGQAWIVEELFSVYFGVQFRQLVDELKDTEITPTISAEKTKKKLWGDYFYGSKKGNVLEAVEAMASEFMQKNFGGQVKRTGATGMKADNIITYNIDVDFSEIFKNTEKNASVRARSVDRLQNLFNQVGTQGGYIVEISDKNYSLTSKAFAEKKGFAAQTGFKLEHLDTLLRKVGAVSDIEALMFVLANTDAELVGGPDADTACRFIATYIGYFLFDDLQIDEMMPGLSTQAIHLFNLDGVYIPLSVFLRAAYDAFTKMQNATQYVNVTFNSEFDYKKQTDGLQESDWTALYRQRLAKSSVDVHFFGDFVNYIKANVQL